jgi:hypothetical protein
VKRQFNIATKFRVKGGEELWHAASDAQQMLFASSELRPSLNNCKEPSLESKQGSLHKLDKIQCLSIGEKGRATVPLAQVEVQRYMRPEVSTLIRATIYLELVDHATTLTA